jgi:hypothetical protein
MPDGQKLFGDVTLDALKSKAVLATDSNGVIIEGTGGSAGIQQLTADPASPTAEEAWVLYTAAVGEGIPLMMFPLLILSPGIPASYQFSYRTNQGNTKRVTLT